jgi:HAD superfamily hydrolase (TIGR01509 family)
MMNASPISPDSMTPKTLIFDFDGTLADCQALHQWAFRSAAQQVCAGIDYLDSDLEGLPTSVKIQILLDQGWQFDPVALNEIKQELTLSRVEEYIRPDPELKSLFDTLSKHYSLCLASNARRDFIIQCLEILDLWSWSCVLTASIYPAKPDTTMFLQAMRLTQSDPAHTVIIEDSVVGITCARQTGARVLETTGVAQTKEYIREFIRKK